ncbi:MAG: serine/threonine protein kinase, partial [Actinomycetota bacterium]|nr:serine/threonine protein kinase [Actinomycetota bacterium]
PSTAELPAGAAAPRRLLVPAAALLVGVGLGVGALQVVGGQDAGTPVAVADTPAPTTPPVEPVAALVVTAADHVGRPVEEVEAELAALGLWVQRETAERSDVPLGQVVEIGPVGALAPGDLVTLTVAVAPPAPAPAPVPAPVVPEPAPAPVVPEVAPAPVAPVPVAPDPAPVPPAPQLVPPAPEPVPVPAGDEEDDEQASGKGKGKSKSEGWEKRGKGRG